MRTFRYRGLRRAIGTRTPNQEVRKEVITSGAWVGKIGFKADN